MLYSYELRKNTTVFGDESKIYSLIFYDEFSTTSTETKKSTMEELIALMELQIANREERMERQQAQMEAQMKAHLKQSAQMTSP